MKCKKEESKRHYRINCFEALSEVKDEAIKKYNLEIINNSDLSEAFALINNLEFLCFSCKGGGEIYKVVEEINNINNASEKEKIKTIKTGNVFHFDFSRKGVKA